MKSLQILTVTMIVVISATKVRGDESFIEKTCKQTPNYRLCVSLLKSDPGSSAADTTGLALILVDKIKGKATETQREIKGLTKTRPELSEALKSCTSKYKAILDADVPEAVYALQVGRAMYAENGVADAAIEAANCEAEFKGQSPLTALTKSMEDIADVARAIIRTLL